MKWSEDKHLQSKFGEVESRSALDESILLAFFVGYYFEKDMKVFSVNKDKIDTEFRDSFMTYKDRHDFVMLDESSQRQVYNSWQLSKQLNKNWYEVYRAKVKSTYTESITPPIVNGVEYASIQKDVFELLVGPQLGSSILEYMAAIKVSPPGSVNLPASNAEINIHDRFTIEEEPQRPSTNTNSSEEITLREAP